MHLIDSSAWLEFFAGSPLAKPYEKKIQGISHVLVPTIVLYEVFKKISFERGEAMALQLVAHMRQGIVVELDVELALSAAQLSLSHHIPMADSIILATAKKYQATVWTHDQDFKNIKGVRYMKKS